MQSIGTWWLWIGFFLFVAVMLTVDMFLLARKKVVQVSTREALAWTVVWFSCAMLFNFMLWRYLNGTVGAVIAQQKALEFFTGYCIEEALSVDNMFVFVMIFGYFSVPARLQRRVLLYGVLGAVVLRLLVILGGAWLVQEVHWVLYLFGLFLLYTGIKMLFSNADAKDLAENSVLIWLRRHLRITQDFHGERFLIKQNLLWYATPLFLVLILVELTDVVFALDSIPAIFAITNDPFIVFTSNIFAVLGLRALYFLLANMASRFYLLKYGIAIILLFVGAKMLIAHWIEIPILIALSVVVAILATTVVLSVLNRKG